MWPFYQVTGLSRNSSLANLRPQAACGTCLEVRCADSMLCDGANSVVVMVTDACDNCGPETLNMNAYAFQQLISLDVGSVAIQYRQVECTPLDNITVRVGKYRTTDGGWIRLNLMDVGGDGGIASVELSGLSTAVTTSNALASPLMSKNTNGMMTSTGASPPSLRLWRSMDNSFGAQWELSELPPPPYSLRVSDIFGRSVVLEDIIPSTTIVGDFFSSGQFSSLSSSLQNLNVENFLKQKVKQNMENALQTTSTLSLADGSNSSLSSMIAISHNRSDNATKEGSSVLKKNTAKFGGRRSMFF
mmetsp:Transcript_9907/g.18467  ORF Transcript_9907/g.18467 Transcript_9907/m.18467 type:complete len:302 (-) Transcript_9907:69-974(-)